MTSTVLDCACAWVPQSSLLWVATYTRVRSLCICDFKYFCCCWQKDVGRELRLADLNPDPITQDWDFVLLVLSIFSKNALLPYTYLLKDIFIFLLCICASMYMYVSCECLMLLEARKGCQISWNWSDRLVNDHVGSGNRLQVFCKDSYLFYDFVSPMCAFLVTCLTFIFSQFSLAIIPM